MEGSTAPGARLGPGSQGRPSLEPSRPPPGGCSLRKPDQELCSTSRQWDRVAPCPAALDGLVGTDTPPPLPQDVANGRLAGASWALWTGRDVWTSLSAPQQLGMQGSPEPIAGETMGSHGLSLTCLKHSTTEPAEEMATERAKAISHPLVLSEQRHQARAKLQPVARSCSWVPSMGGSPPSTLHRFPRHTGRELDRKCCGKPAEMLTAIGPVPGMLARGPRGRLLGCSHSGPHAGPLPGRATRRPPHVGTLPGRATRRPPRRPPSCVTPPPAGHTGTTYSHC